MSASAGFAASSAAFSASSAASARRAKAERCRLELQEYDPQTATVNEMQSYADCIETLHPDAATGMEIVMAKLFVSLAIAGAAWGAWNGWKYPLYDLKLATSITLALCGGILLPFIVAAIGALVLGALWVVS